MVKRKIEQGIRRGGTFTVQYANGKQQRNRDRDACGLGCVPEYRILRLSSMYSS